MRTKPQFKREESNPFFSLLKQDTKPLFEAYANKARKTTWAKVIIYPLLYAMVYSILLLKGENIIWFYCCYILLGLLVTLNVFNIVHDAVHHALFEKSKLNKRAALLLDIMGGNSFVWGKRHVLYHHTFTNVPNWDIDVQQTELVKFNPRQQYKWHHQYQYLYMPVLYLFYSLNWILVRDFKDFYHKKSLVKQKTTIPLAEYYKLFTYKLLYVLYLVVIPVIYLSHQWYHFVTGILLMHWFTSALTLLVLLPSHLDEHAVFPEPDENLLLEDTWAVHQLKVTNDFGTNNWFLNFVMGGLNHHIAHHLFPKTNHNIIPHLTKKIEMAAKQNSLPYRCYTLKEVMVSHFKLLKKNGQRHNFFEE